MFLGSTNKIGYTGNKGIVTSNILCLLDASINDSYPGTGTTWYNILGAGGNGQLVNGVGYNSANGGSLTFDGSNDYMNLQFPNVQSFTLSMAIKFNSSDIPSDNQHRTIICNRAGGSQSSVPERGKFNIRFNRSGTSRRIAMQFYETTATSPYQGIDILGPSYDDSNYSGKWSVHTVTLDSNAFIYYLNGDQYGINTNFDGTKLQTFYLFMIARDRISSWEHSKIQVASLYMFNKSLTSQEVKQNFNAQRARLSI